MPITRPRFEAPPVPVLRRGRGDLFLLSADAIKTEVDAINTAKAARDKENEERLERLKALGKYVPVIGAAFPVLVDFGAWLGKRLGSNWDDQYTPEDLNHVAREVEAWLDLGWIPPNPATLLSEKDGAKNFGNGLAYRREAALDLSGHRYPSGYDDKGANTHALAELGRLTLKHASSPSVSPSLDALGRGNDGTLVYSTKWDDVSRVIGALAAAEAGVDSSTYQARAKQVADEVWRAMYDGASRNPHPIDPSAPFPTSFEEANREREYSIGYPLALVADTFVTVMREAYTERPPKFSLVDKALFSNPDVVEEKASTGAVLAVAAAGSAVVGGLAWFALKTAGKLPKWLGGRRVRR